MGATFSQVLSASWNGLLVALVGRKYDSRSCDTLFLSEDGGYRTCLSSLTSSSSALSKEGENLELKLLWMSCNSVSKLSLSSKSESWLFLLGFCELELWCTEEEELLAWSENSGLIEPLFGNFDEAGDGKPQFCSEFSSLDGEFLWYRSLAHCFFLLDLPNSVRSYYPKFLVPQQSFPGEF